MKQNEMVQNEMNLETTPNHAALQDYERHATVSGVVGGLQAWTKHLGHTLNLELRSTVSLS